MTKVQQYLKKKKIQELGLPKIWVVKSDRTGVEKPIEHQVIEIKENVSKIISKKSERNIHRYKIEKSPYQIDIIEGDTFSKNDGYGTGFGDLWCWSYFSSFSKEAAEKYYIKELIKINNDYGKFNN